MDAQEDFDVIIVGGGMGGLMTAALLCKQGRKVLVVEALDCLGGFQRSVAYQGFTIEPHFHFLQEAGYGRNVHRLFEAIGIAPELLPLEPIAEFVFGDKCARIGNDRAAFIKDLKGIFPQESAGIDALFDSMAQLYECLTEWPASALQQAGSSQLPQDLSQLPPSLATILRHANDTLDAYLSRYVDRSELKAMLGGWATYFGYCGSRISALPVIVLSEACWDGGVHHPRSGIGAVIRELRRVIEHTGGTLRLSTPVKKILVERQRAVGIELENGPIIRASAIISNVDVISTFVDLVGTQQVPDVVDALNSLERFRPPFTVYVGVRAQGLGLESRAAVQVAFPNYDVEDGDLAQIEGRFDDIAVSIGIPTLVTPELAPSGHHLLKIYTFLDPAIVTRLLQDAAYRDQCADKMIAAAERSMPGLTDNLVMRCTSFDIVPDIYNRNTLGAIGWAPNLATMMSAPDQKTAIEDLYLTGQWTNTGPAMNNVFRSSQRIAALIAERAEKPLA